MSESVHSPLYGRLREILIAHRRSSGITQAQLAARLRKPQSFVSKFERGERSLNVIEFLQVVDALGADAATLLAPLSTNSSGELFGDRIDQTILETWQLTPRELTKVVNDNPSLRGILFGYVAELKLSEMLDAMDDVTDSMKYDDHDRTNKGDRVVQYRNRRIIIESKSLQSNSIRYDEKAKRWTGKAQVDASDRRKLTLPDGSKLETTLLLAGEFDILAVNVFQFEQRWQFLFAKNTDLPRSSYRKYTPKQRKHLLASLVTVTWPPEPPFRADIVGLLNDIVRQHDA